MASERQRPTQNDARICRAANNKGTVTERGGRPLFVDKQAVTSGCGKEERQRATGYTRRTRRQQ